MAARATDQASLEFLRSFTLEPSDIKSETEVGTQRQTAVPPRIPVRPPHRRPDAWKGWPENCRNSEAAIDDATHVRSYFCPSPDCLRLCRRSKVFRLAEYSSTGASTFNDQVGVGELDAHFRAYDRVRQTRGRTPAPMFRVFFPCSHYGGESTKTPCIRRFLSFFQAPIDVALTLKTDNFGRAFQAFTESATTIDGTQTKILHCWTKCRLHLLRDDFLADVELYSADIQGRYEREAKDDPNSIGGWCNPALYLIYNYETGEVTMLTMSHGPLFHRFRLACSKAATVRPGEDPFVLFNVFYACLLDAAERTATFWHTRASIDAKSFASRNDYVQLLTNFSRNRRHNLRSASSMKRIAGDIEIAKSEHTTFLTLRVVDEALSRRVDATLGKHYARARQLATVYGDCADVYETSIKVLLGFSQLHNGLNMYQIAKDNGKQAEATEAIARAAKRDGEIMKMVTVVTLVYLPATFVCTLLSMGIFQFSDKNTVEIARSGWLFFAISIPLTALTLGLAYAKWPGQADAPFGKSSNSNSSTTNTMLSNRGQHMKQRNARGRTADGGDVLPL